MVLLFLLGLPVYAISMALILKWTSSSGLVAGIKPWKELLPIIFLLAILLNYAVRHVAIRLTRLDILVLMFILFNLLQFIRPGEVGILVRMYSFRINTVFGLIYFLGRVIPISLSRQQQVLWLLTAIGVLAGVVAILEVLKVVNMPELVGLTDYSYATFGQEQSGEFGLTWSFQTPFGYRRYSSIFANPLELASSTLLTGAAVMYLLYGQPTAWKQRAFYRVSLALIIISLLLSVSRSSTVAFLIQISILSIWLRQKHLLLFWVVLTAIGGVFIIKNPLLVRFILDTIQFTNPSSIGHASEWMEGFRAMLADPMGMGLGTSGSTAARFGQHIGGENQFIIIGVETGIIGLLLYVLILGYSIYYGYKGFRTFAGPTGGLCFVAAAAKLGLLLPSFTSAIETYVFIMFISWWLVGFSVQQLVAPIPALMRNTHLRRRLMFLSAQAR